jgi:hypothetical protein
MLTFIGTDYRKNENEQKMVELAKVVALDTFGEFSLVFAEFSKD